jgi:hypothetical protein
MLARHFAVLRPHTANKMLRLAISKRPMPTAPVMSIPLIPFALRCQGSFDPGLRVFNGQRRAVDFARCSLARPSGVSRRFRADARGFPILVARESDLDANDGPLPFFFGVSELEARTPFDSRPERFCDFAVQAKSSLRRTFST